jgi:hypothetical protein
VISIEPCCTLASRRTSATESASVDVLRELPQRSKMLLLAAFLCSHNPPEQDMLIFSPEGVRGGRRKKQRSGGQQARAAPIGQGGMTAEQRRRADISEAQHSVSAVKQRFVGPLPFPWERLLAVLHSIQAIQTGTAKQRSSGAHVFAFAARCFSSWRRGSTTTLGSTATAGRVMRKAPRCLSAAARTHLLSSATRATMQPTSVFKRSCVVTAREIATIDSAHARRTANFSSRASLRKEGRRRFTAASSPTAWHA